MPKFTVGHKVVRSPRRRPEKRLFEVVILREIRHRNEIEVRAVDEAEAMTLAKELADSQGGWVEGDIIDEDVKVREIGGES